MTQYKCGHKTKGMIIMDSNPLSLAAYFEWNKTVGLEGGKKQCFDCWNKIAACK